MTQEVAEDVLGAAKNGNVTLFIVKVLILPIAICQVVKVLIINKEALCAAFPEALAHSPSQMQLSCPVAPASQRELHKAQRRRRRQRWWCGEEGARRPVPEGQVLHQVLLYVLRSVLRHVLHRVLHVLVLHVSPKGKPRAPNAKARKMLKF